MASHQPMKLSGDPRRPSEVQRYIAPVKAEDAAADARVVGAMLFGLAAMLLKISWFGWAGVLLLLNYLANFAARDFDLKATMSSIFFTVSGLAGSYISPGGQGSPSSAIAGLFKGLFGKSS